MYLPHEEKGKASIKTNITGNRITGIVRITNYTRIAIHQTLATITTFTIIIFLLFLLFIPVILLIFIIIFLLKLNTCIVRVYVCIVLIELPAGTV